MQNPWRPTRPAKTLPDAEFKVELRAQVWVSCKADGSRQAGPMRYLVEARVKSGREAALQRAIADGSLGRGSIAGDEYLDNMQTARRRDDGTAVWVEVCFCASPLAEERAYWEEFFELLSVQDAHARSNCRHENGTEPWACCDCTRELEAKLQREDQPFLATLPAART